MKKFATAVMMTSCLIATAKAGPSVNASICDNPQDPQHRRAQCMYITGLNDQDKQRWIKFDSPVFSSVFCIGSLEQTHRYTIMEAYYPVTKSTPPISSEISICPDSSGRNCKPIASYTFSCQTDSGEGRCTPQDMPVDVTNVKSHFPACDAFSYRSFMNHHTFFSKVGVN